MTQLETESPGEPQEPEFQILDLAETADLPQERLALPGADSGEGDGKEDRKSRSVSTKPPTADEWQEFIGGTVLRLLTEGYLHFFLFRYVDESDLSPREREMVRLTKDELREMAAPVATVAAKNRMAKKHGRVIIASAESYEALIDLFFWMKRVSKIARNHKRKNAAAVVTNPDDVMEGTIFNGPIPGSDEQTVGGFPDPNGTIYNRGTG